MANNIPRRNMERALIFLVFAVPLVFSARSYNLIFIKNIFLTAGIISLIIFTARRADFKAGRESFIPASFLLWAVVSAFFSKYSFASFPALSALFGSCLLFFTVANARGLDRGYLRTGFIIAAAIPVIIGFGQAIIPGFTPGLMAFGTRITSTLGNPNFFGAYLAAVIPLIIMASINSKTWNRIIYGVLGAAAIYCLIKTGSKAAYAALVLEILMVIVYALRNNKNGKAVISSVIAAVVAAGIISLPVIFGVPAARVLDPAAWMANESVFFRANTWAGALEMVKHNWFFGCGPGAFYLDFPAFRPEAIMKWSAEHSYEITGAENILLQAGAETGIPGLIIVIAMAFFAVKKWKFDADGFAIALAGLFTVNLFGIDANYAPSAMFLAVYGGLLFSAEKDDRAVDMSRFKKHAAAAAVVLAIVIIIYQSFCHVSDIFLKNAINFSENRQWPEAISEYKKSLSANRYNITASYFLAATYSDSGDAAAALKQLQETEKLAPDYVLLHYKKASIYNAAGDTANAVDEYKKMLKIDPYLKPALLELAYIYYNNLRDYDSAAKCLLKALEKYPLDPSLYNNLGNIYYMAGRREECVSAYKKAIEINPNKDYYYNLGSVYKSYNDPVNAKKCMLEAQKLAKTGGLDTEKALKKTGN